jgi:CTP-dependent riboflavin kinase
MPDDDRRGVALRRIRTLRDERNRDTVKSYLVAETTDYSPKEMARTLVSLADDGYLERWGGSTPQTYRITLNDGATPE